MHETGTVHAQVCAMFQMYEQKPVDSNILVEEMVQRAPLQLLTNQQLEQYLFHFITRNYVGHSEGN